MNKTPLSSLSRRERQIMEIIYQKGKASVAEVQEMLLDPPSYSTVRALLRVLEDKGHLEHEEEGQRYLYRPVVDRRNFRSSALKHVVNTLFGGSITEAVAALLGDSAQALTDADLKRLSEAIEKARREGR